MSFSLFSFEGANPKTVGIYNGEGPPVPIPNTEVKLTSAEDTCLETDWKNRSMPTQRNRVANATLFFFLSFPFTNAQMAEVGEAQAASTKFITLLGNKRIEFHINNFIIFYSIFTENSF